MKIKKQAFVIITVLCFCLSICPASASNIKISNKKITLEVGKKKKLSVKGTKKKVSWKSSDKKIATVNKKGIVKAKSTGKAVVTAKAGRKKYKCVVKVKMGSSVPDNVVVTDDDDDGWGPLIRP